MAKDRKWATIPGFEDYLVSDDGLVWSKERYLTYQTKDGRWFDKLRKGKLIKGTRQRDGRRVVDLPVEGGKYCVAVSRLMLMAFVGLPEKGQEGRHLNGDATYDVLSNLAWGSRSDNQQDAVRHGTQPGLVYYGEKHSNTKLTAEQVKDIRRLHATGQFTQQELAEYFEVTQPYISKIILLQTRRRG